MYGEHFEDGRAEQNEKPERDIAAELDELRALFERLVEYLKAPHGIHFPH